MFAGKRYWIVGASEGLGRALARSLDARGARLILSARNEARLTALAAELDDAMVLPMDVTDAGSVAQAAAAVGDFDGIVYAAGFYEPMRADEWGAKAATAMCEVNFMGAMRVLGHVAPAFAARGTGHIVLIGSLSGFRGLPGAIGYSASKAALMSLGESLYADLRHRGVTVQIVSPGFIRTRLSEKNDFTMPQIMAPDDAAARIVTALESGRFHTAFPRPFSWLFTLGRLLPGTIFYRILGS